jgi:hypothetical protein
MTESASSTEGGLWERYVMAVEDVGRRLERIARALEEAGVPFALVGGQAVALWVATKDPAAVRTTKDVDLLLRRDDLPRARAAARVVGMDYFEVMGVGMFLERDDPHPRSGVRLVWAGERVRPEHALPAPRMEERQTPGHWPPVVALGGLVRMKLMADRDQDRVHLRDLIEVGLVDRRLLAELPPDLARRLEALFDEAGR